MSASRSLPAVQVPDDREVDAALWDAYKYILSLSRRRLARQAAEREAAAIADGDTKTGEVCDA